MKKITPVAMINARVLADRISNNLLFAQLNADKEEKQILIDNANIAFIRLSRQMGYHIIPNMEEK